MKLLFIYLSFFFLLPYTLLANDPIQSKVNKVKLLPVKEIKSKANQYYEELKYKEAYIHFLALDQVKRKLKATTLYRLGASALYVEAYPTAIKYLKQVLDKQHRFPLVVFEYAKALMFNKEYKNAQKYFKYYIQTNQVQNNNEYIPLAQKHINTCEKNMLVKETTVNQQLENISKDFTKEVAVRSLTRKSKYNFRLVECQTPKGSCIKKVRSDNSLAPLKGSISNPLFNSGSPHIAPNGTTLYFTQQEITKTGAIEYKIFTAEIQPNGEINTIKKLGSSVNRNGFSSLHPCVAYTERGQEILYFASEQPGSLGGYDLWFSVKMKNGQFTRAYNLGSRINSQQNEVTPFYNDIEEQLYFSSNKDGGFGGLDIYKMTGEKMRWEEKAAELLDESINSKANESHFLIDENGQQFITTDGNKQQQDQIYKVKSKKDRV